MLRLAQSEPPLPMEPDVLDRMDWLLNCKNGTIDLKTGDLLKFRREDFFTKQCPVAFNREATCPTWDKFINDIFAGSVQMVEFVQRLLGYALTGSVREQIMPICYGKGANGKSTLIETIFAMLGPDYSGKAPRELLMKKHGSSHPTAMTTLHGKRFVAAVETEDGCQLDETLIKEITGGDTINARRMREDFWEFTPTHKIALATNYRPNVTGTDEAIWRRLMLIPFNVTFPKGKRDEEMPTKLRAELPGILAWCVRGCLAWQRSKEGLAAPTIVTNATIEYRQEEDDLAPFLDTECVIGQNEKCKASHLQNAFEEWNGGKIDGKAFASRMKARGHVSKAAKGCKWYRGIGLRSPRHEVNQGA